MATSLTAVGTVWASLSLIAAILCCSGFYLPFWIQAPEMASGASRGVHWTPCSCHTVTYDEVAGFLIGQTRLIKLPFGRRESPVDSGHAIGLWIHDEGLFTSKRERFQVRFEDGELIPQVFQGFEGSLFNKVDAYFSSFRRCNYPRVSSAGVVEIIQECGRYSRFWDIPSPWWQASTILVGVASGLSLLVGVTASAACCVTYVVHIGTARAAGFLQLFSALMVCGGVVLYPIGWDNREIKESCGESAHVYKIGNCNVSWSAYLLLGAVTLLLFCFGLSFCASRIKPGGSFRI